MVVFPCLLYSSHENFDRSPISRISKFPTITIILPDVLDIHSSFESVPISHKLLTLGTSILFHLSTSYNSPPSIVKTQAPTTIMTITSGQWVTQDHIQGEGNWTRTASGWF